jgi:hypothetical protein
MGNEDLQNARDMMGINVVLTTMEMVPDQLYEVRQLLESIEFNANLLSQPPIAAAKAQKTLKKKGDQISQLGLVQMLLARTANTAEETPFEKRLNALIEECDSDYPSDEWIRLHVTRLKKAVNTAIAVFFGTQNAMLNEAVMNTKGKITPIKDNLIYSEKIKKMFEKRHGQKGDVEKL